MIEDNRGSSSSPHAAKWASTTRPGSLPAHLIGLEDSSWALWRTVCLRGAGFPVTQVLLLSAPECTIAADACLRTNSAAATAEFHRCFTQTTIRISQQLCEIAQTERFREAITWQNREVVHTAVVPLLRRQQHLAKFNSKQRKYERLVTNYLQRYCTKNDSIGFFGPIGWATLSAQGDAITVQPGPQLLAARQVFFENWCIDALADTLSRDANLRLWFIPRRMPHITIDGTNLLLPFAAPLQLSPHQVAVLQACDGVKTARTIAYDLLHAPHSVFQNEEDVFAILEQLQANKRITWTLEVSPEDAHPERQLRRCLHMIDDQRCRETAITMLDELVAKRDTVAHAAGDVKRLDEALADIETTFTHLTGLNPTREAGKTYAARTLLYEDCRRDIEIVLGPDFIRALSPSLSLLLTAARWFTYHIARLFLQAFKKAYAELARKAGTLTINFAEFWLWVQPLVFEDTSHLVDSLLIPFQQRWSELLTPTAQSEQHNLHFTAEELQARVLDLFAAPYPGWRLARYHSPDILIHASCPEAIRAGDYQFVLGEFHMGINTLDGQGFLNQHPDPEQLLRHTELDLSDPLIVPMMPRVSFPGSRTRPALFTPKDFRLIFAPDLCSSPPQQLLPIGELVIESSAGKLHVRTRDGRRHFDLIEIFGQMLSILISNSFKILTPAKHTPRITIDRMVIARECWNFTPDEIPFALHSQPEDRFVAARQWLHKFHLPRFVFIKTVQEKKPCYIDLESPPSIEIAAKLVHRCMQSDSTKHEPITISEMLPTPDQTWLTDAEGQRYVSELRFIALDRREAAGIQKGTNNA